MKSNLVTAILSSGIAKILDHDIDLVLSYVSIHSRESLGSKV